MAGHMMGGRMFETADANKDGSVSLQEATDAALQHFDMADANRDGQITPRGTSARCASACGLNAARG